MHCSSRALEVAHRPAALRRAATTRAGAPEGIVHGQLFSGLDFPKTVKEDSATDFAHRQIWIAAMVDEFCATASDGPIKERAPVPANRIRTAHFPCPDCAYDTAREFAPADRLSGVLDDPVSDRNRFLCEDTKPFDAGPTDDKLKTGKLRVENCSVTLCRHIYRAQTRSGVPRGYLLAHLDFSIFVNDRRGPLAIGRPPYQPLATRA